MSLNYQNAERGKGFVPDAGIFFSQLGMSTEHIGSYAVAENFKSAADALFNSENNVNIKRVGIFFAFEEIFFIRSDKILP